MKLDKQIKTTIKDILKLEAKKELARRSLVHFTKYTYPGYETNWHHKVYAEKLDQFTRGEIKKMMVFMPPQHGKSELCSRRLPAKMIAENKDLRIAIVSYNSKLGVKFAREIRNICLENSYKDLFGNLCIGQYDNYISTAEEFEIPGHKGSVYGTGVGGGLTSRSVDVLIIDDPYKDAADAWSPTIRENVQDWYDTTARTRLHNESQQLLTMTRWHPDDLAGYLLSIEDDWEVVIFPALKENDNNKEDVRQIGEALWPNKHSKEKLEAIKLTNPVVFGSLYQQNPQPAEGLLFDSQELKYFSDYSSRLHDPDAGVFGICDIADEGSDYLAFGIFNKYGQDLYLMDVVFSQANAEKTEPQVASMIDYYNSTLNEFESNNGGKFYARNIQKLVTKPTKISWKPTTQNKETRILLKSGVVKQNIYFRKDSKISQDYKKFMEQLTSYQKEGKNKHDDAADLVTMAIEKILERKTVKVHNVSIF